MEKPKNATAATGFLAALLIGALSGAPAGAASHGEQQKGPDGLKQDFRTLDKNGDRYLSLEEFKPTGKDDLAFKAADLDGDNRLDADEYAKYGKAQEADQEMRQR
jgi:hypothetical protein